MNKYTGNCEYVHNYFIQILNRKSIFVQCLNKLVEAFKTLFGFSKCYNRMLRHLDLSVYEIAAAGQKEIRCILQKKRILVLATVHLNSHWLFRMFVHRTHNHYFSFKSFDFSTKKDLCHFLFSLFFSNEVFQIIFSNIYFSC